MFRMDLEICASLADWSSLPVQRIRQNNLGLVNMHDATLLGNHLRCNMYSFRLRTQVNIMIGTSPACASRIAGMFSSIVSMPDRK